jgi:TPR repeat protein
MKLTLKHAVAAILLVLSFATPVVAGPFQDAAAAYGRGDYATALRLFQPLADNGDVAAQMNVGVMYANGQGVPQDYSEAAKRYGLAADHGYAPAQLNLAIMFTNGQGVPQNYVLAYKWFSLSAAQGNTEATKGRDNVAALMTPAQIAEARKLVPAPVAVVPEPRLTSPNNQQTQNIAGYKQCNSNAQESYNSNWGDNCARIHEKELDDYYTCLQQHPGGQYNNDPWGCGRIYRTDTESKNCRLPILLADSLKNDLWHAQDMCSRSYGLH